jgi:Sulfotransferase family
MHHRNVALVEVLREITGTRVVIDSSKIALHLRFLLKSEDLKIKIIFLVRDGRAVTTSMLGHGTKSVEEAAMSWRRNNEAAERVLVGLPRSQWMQLQYEELCRRPEETLRGICKFLGMDTNNITLDFRSRTQHVLGNDMRLKSGSEIRLDERWRKSLSEGDLKIFEEVAGDANRKYGYQ